jgi:predicted nucleic acid-binding protein
MTPYFDTMSVIYAIEGRADVSSKLLDLLSHVDVQATTSELTLAEVLVRPFRSKDEALEYIYRTLLAEEGLVEFVAIDRDTLLDAARVRAAFQNIKLPDAIHLASAIRRKASHFVTYDEQLLRLPWNDLLDAVDRGGQDGPRRVDTSAGELETMIANLS